MLPSDQVTDMSQLQQRRRASYNRLAPIYDWISGPSETALRHGGLRLLAPRPGERLLEIGFGTGQALPHLVQAAGPQGLVAGVDLSEKMAAQARQRLERSGLWARCLLTQAEACALPYPAAAFCGALLSFTLELFETPEIPLLLAELRRVLAPQGRLVVIALDLPPRPGVVVRLYQAVHRRWPGVVDCRPIPVLALLEQAGFCIHTVQPHLLWGLPVVVALATH